MVKSGVAITLSFDFCLQLISLLAGSAITMVQTHLQRPFGLIYAWTLTGYRTDLGYQPCILLTPLQGLRISRYPGGYVVTAAPGG